MKIIWSPLSIEQLSEISTYIAQDKPMAAENWVEEDRENCSRNEQ